MAMNGTWPLAADLMTPNPITVDTETQLSAAIGLMRSKSIHELPVLKARKLVGMITYDALARRLNVSLTAKVENFMVVAPTVTPQADYTIIADKLLASGRRAACVVDPRRGGLVGIVSRTDLVRVMPGLSSLADKPVLEVMSPSSVPIHEADPLRSLAAHIRALEEHPLPVLDAKGHLTGAIAVSDLGNAYWRPQGGGSKDAAGRIPAGDVLVRSIMSTPPLTLPESATAGDAARAMTRAKTSSVFVVDGDRALGIISQTDLLGLAVRAKVGQEGTYIEITGFGAGTDAELMGDLDRILGAGLKRIAKSVKPIMLSVHVTPHASHRVGDASVETRLHTDWGVFYASRTDWNVFQATTDTMDELERQVRETKTGARQKSRGAGRRLGEVDTSDTLSDPEVEARLADTLPARRPRGASDRRRK